MKKGFLELEMISDVELKQVFSELNDKKCKYVHTVSEPVKTDNGLWYESVIIYGEMPSPYDEIACDESRLYFYDFMEEVWEKEFSA